MTSPGSAWRSTRRAVLVDAGGIGVAVGTYAVSFGAVSVSAGLTVAQTMVLSALMFTGGSQFALVGVLGSGGNPVTAVLTSVILGVRNMFYALRVAPTLGLRGPRRLLGAHLTIDESSAMALRYGDNPRASRLAFWSTGISVYVLWNIATLTGALATSAIGDPRTFGLDAAIPAGFLALVWPQLRTPRERTAAGVAGVLAIVATPVLTPGVPVLLGALGAVITVTALGIGRSTGEPA